MNFKRFICRIFGHRPGGWYESVEDVTMGNGRFSHKKTKRARKKKKVVRTFRKCERCGALIMVGKRNRY